MSLSHLLFINAAILGIFILLLWRYCVAIRDVSVIDAFWPLGMVIMAGSTFVMADGSFDRKLMLLVLTALWGLRLSIHLFVRWRTYGVDPRYAAILGSAMEEKGWSFAKASLIQVFLLQMALLFIVCLPAQLGQIEAEPNSIGLIGWLGTALALIGIGFETIGDAQLKRFRSNPANTGKVLNTGLWRFTRHPNYFGDALTWWGIWLVAAETSLGLGSIIGPVLITWLLTRLSGVPMLEQRLKKHRPGYEDYVRRTSAFFPWPPKAKRNPRCDVIVG